MHCERQHPNCSFPFIHPLGPVTQQPLRPLTLLLQWHDLHTVNHFNVFTVFAVYYQFSHRLAGRSVVVVLAKNPTQKLA
jgi:hypothetical protein